MRGVTFGTIHTLTDLNLILQEENITPASPKLNYKDIPGADGSKDLTEALGVGVKFNDSQLEWIFALYPTDDWATKRKDVSGAINGLACDIVLDSDPNYVYKGRVEVSAYKADKMLRQITIKATCSPYKLKPEETTVSRDDLTTNYKTLSLTNGRMPVMPTITVEQETSILFDGVTTVLSAGTHVLQQNLKPGTNTLKAKLTDAAAENTSISVTYQEGELV